jgi:hypothetical protein
MDETLRWRYRKENVDRLAPKQVLDKSRARVSPAAQGRRIA